MSLVGRRERTERQVRDHLTSRGFGPRSVEDAVARLVDIDAVDDARYARLFAEDKRELEGWGPERIVTTLVDHGVPRSVIERAVEPEPREDQLERAADLLAARGDLDTDAGRRKALSFLARRGFEAELCYDAIRRAA